MEEEFHRVPGAGFPRGQVRASNGGFVGNFCPNGQNVASLNENADVRTNGFTEIITQQSSQRLQPTQRIAPYFAEEISGGEFSSPIDNSVGSTNRWVHNAGGNFTSNMNSNTNTNANTNANTNGNTNGKTNVGGAGHHTEFTGNGTYKTAAIPIPISSNNAHTINDPLIQESLSPFFQPFGIDVTHFPLTNPPIFQSTLTSIDEPVKRRRISISNGQINQLSEDLETLENLYNTQPPPLPHRFDNYQTPATVQLPQSKVPVNMQRQPPKVSLYEPNNPSPVSHNHIPQGAATIVRNLADGDIAGLHSSAIQQQRVSPGTWANSSSEVGPTEVSSEHTPQTTIYDANASLPKRSSSNSSGSSHNSRPAEPIPGTNAWKRARLLERNRMAASKCRQRKKVAQLQLQKDFDVLSRENNVMKRKLDYYEKLVTKFKRFSEAHLRKCTGSDESLEIIEEMLMIDSGIKEVNNSGLVIKLEESRD